MSESEGDTVRLLVAMPLVNPRRISVKLDGVQIFNSLGIANPASCTPGSPCAGMVNINDRRTPTRGKELTVLQQLFSNIGRFPASTGQQ